MNIKTAISVETTVMGSTDCFVLAISYQEDLTIQTETFILNDSQMAHLANLGRAVAASEPDDSAEPETTLTDVCNALDRIEEILSNRLHH